MVIVGLTGGIGSGKTLICKIFETFGVHVFYADHEARKVMEGDPAVRKAITSQFGKDIYMSGNLDRKKLASVVFHDKNALNRLNSIVHPAVRKKFEQWIKVNKGDRYIIEEAAVLLESGGAGRFSLIVTVSVPESLRILRVQERNGISEEDIRLRMKNQLSEEERNSRADVVIVNDGTELVIPQVWRLHHLLMERET